MPTTPTSLVNRLMGVEAFTDSLTFTGGFTAGGTVTLPSGLTIAAGGGTNTLLASGNLYRRILTTANGINPSATAADKIVDAFTLPAGAFDQTGRILTITCWGTFANNANGKTIKFYFGASNTSPPIDGTTTVTGGTAFITTGSVTTTGGGGWFVTGQLAKTGAANSNTQESMLTGCQFAATPAALGSWADQTALTENAASLIVITMNCATTATDLKYQGCEFIWSN